MNGDPSMPERPNPPASPGSAPSDQPAPPHHHAPEPPPAQYPSAQQAPAQQPPAQFPPAQYPSAQQPPAQQPSPQWAAPAAPTQAAPTQAAPIQPGSFQPAPSSAAASVGPVELLDSVSSTQTTSTAVTKKPSSFLRVGLIGALGMVGVAGAFAVQSALSEPAGPQSPDDAVGALFTAIENEDVLGAAEVLLPSERESLVEPSLELFAEIERIGVVEEGTDLNSVGGVDIEIDGLTYESTPIGDGVVNVVVTGGTVTTTTNPSELPVGSALTDRMDEPLESQPTEVDVDDLGDNELRFTVVEEDGGWYVSVWYTAAEAVRAVEGRPAPVFGEGPLPVGASSPEAVIEQMAAEMVELDWEGVLTLMDPREARVLYDYSPLVLPEWQASTNEFRNEVAGATWSLDSLETSTSERRGQTVVTVDGFAFSVADQGESYTVNYDGRCFNWSDQYSTETICDDELAEPIFGVGAGMTGVDAGFVVVERDGRWYLSLAPTVIGGVTDQLATVETGAFDEWIESWFDELLREFGLGTTAADRFEAIEGPIAAEEIPTTTGPAEFAEPELQTTGPPATDQSAPPETIAPGQTTTVPAPTPEATSAPFTTGVPTPDQLADYRWDRDAFLADGQVFTSSPGWWIDPTGPVAVSAVSVWSSTGDAFLEIAEFSSETDARSSLTSVSELTNDKTDVSMFGLRFVIVDRFVIVSTDDDAGRNLAFAQAEHLSLYLEGQ